MTARWTLPAFAAYGLELEYMIVDRESLAVRPIADQLLRAFAGSDTNEATRGTFGWSNELVRHVAEVKNIVPTPALEALSDRFQDESRAANALLRTVGAQLMPTAMHPWMDPASDTVLWDDPGRIYRTYDRIYGCRGHGWANLQSMHINLPFAGDAQFARLHHSDVASQKFETGLGFGWAGLDRCRDLAFFHGQAANAQYHQACQRDAPVRASFQHGILGGGSGVVGSCNKPRR